MDLQSEIDAASEISADVGDVNKLLKKLKLKVKKEMVKLIHCGLPYISSIISRHGCNS
jgi:hypothetical protein